MRDIRNLTRAELGTLIEWAATEGWNPGLSDRAAFHAADPNGFFGAFVDGQMVAAISSVAYDKGFGFIGLYICHKDWRGQGHGKAVWDAGMAYLGDRTIGLDGVPEQQANYAAMGFVPTYQSIRMTGMVGGRAGGTGSTVALDPMDGPVIADLDRALFPAARPDFLANWLTPPNRGLAIMSGRAARSYGVVRPCRAGYKIGPLFAAHLSDAKTLFAALSAGLSGQLQIDVPVEQSVFIDYLANLGFTKGFGTARMYRGTPPAIGMAQVFGISSLELG